MRKFLAAVAALTMVACGGGGGGGGGSSSASCCSGKSYYSCPSSDEAMKCFNGQGSQCTRDSSKDSSCEN